MIPDKMFCSKMCPLPTVSCGTMKLTFMFDILIFLEKMCLTHNT